MDSRQGVKFQDRTTGMDQVGFKGCQNRGREFCQPTEGVYEVLIYAPDVPVSVNGFQVHRECECAL